MSKFRRSWALLQCSLQVLRAHGRLLLFPLIVMLLMVVIAVCMAAPLALWDTGHAYSDSAHWKAVAERWVTWQDTQGNFHMQPRPAGYVLLAVVYLISTFLATFFNVALYSQILSALRGGPVSISGGLQFAVTRLGAILAWSLFTGLIGLGIRALEERVGIVGRWIVRLIGIAWSVASVFVVPVIVVRREENNPLQLLKESAATLKKTWGESLLGYAGIQFGGLLIIVASVAWLFTGIFAAAMLDSGWIAIFTFFVWAVGLTAFIYLMNVASQVYLAALYLYAAEGVVPAPFDQDQMNTAWKTR